MNFYYGNSETFSIKVDKTTYEFYVYKNITNLASLLLWLNDNTQAPNNVNELYKSLYEINSEKLLDLFLENFSVFCEAYLNLRLGTILKKLIIPYNLTKYPATSFIIRNLEAVYFLYDMEKLKAYFGTFTVAHSLYTKNIENIVPDSDESEATLLYKNVKKMLNCVENPQQKGEILTKNLLDSLITQSGSNNSNNFKSDITKLINKESSFIHFTRRSTSIAYKDTFTNNFGNFSLAINSTIKPHLIILLTIFYFFETALLPSFTYIAEEVNTFNEEMQASTTHKINQYNKIRAFLNNITIEFPTKASNIGTWK